MMELGMLAIVLVGPIHTTAPLREEPPRGNRGSRRS